MFLYRSSRRAATAWRRPSPEAFTPLFLFGGATFNYRSSRGVSHIRRLPAPNEVVGTAIDQRDYIVRARGRVSPWRRQPATIRNTGAYIYVRPRFSVTTTAALAPPPSGETGAVVYFPLRVMSGLWTTSGPTASKDETNLRSWLPAQRTPVVSPNGTMTAPWYTFFDYLCNQKLGGPIAATLPDVVQSIAATQATAQDAAAQTALIAQQSQTNAEALAVAVEVARNNSLTGAESIPPVALTYMEP